MSSSRLHSPFIPDRNTVFRRLACVFFVLLISNVGAMVDLVLHPEIPYFDEEHLIAGGITALTMIFLLAILEMYQAQWRKNETTLRRSEESYRAIFDRASDGILIMSSGGKLIDVNESFARMHGYSTGELLQMNIGDLDTPETSRSTPDRMRWVLGGETLSFEVEHHHKGGHVFPLEVTTNRISMGGEPCILGFHRDITDRKRVEDGMRRTNEMFRSAFEEAPVGMCLVSPEGRFLRVNNVFCLMLEHQESELLAMSFMDVTYPEDRSASREWVGRILAGEEVPKTLEKRYLRKSGNLLWGIVGTFLLRSLDGAPLFFITHIQDITERMRAEEEKLNLERQVQQAQKLESLGVLAGGIAHDFNNLLMVVLGHAEMAQKKISPTSTARWNLTEIMAATQRAADLARQMLAYAGKTLYTLERVGLGELVEEMANLLQTAISKKAILVLNLQRGVPAILADPGQIRQIVTNLIINASEAIGDRDGVITVSVGTTRWDEEILQHTKLHGDLAPERYVHLEVTDTGIGMDAVTRSRIFEPFFSTKFTGRGLGLSAVQGIVHAHKGVLQVYSEPGKGATFKVLFPALEEEGKNADSTGSSSLSDWRGTGTILLVDDEESLLALGTGMLEELGFTVLTAADGLQAVEMYRERGKEIDLVLMDLTMPRMDGEEAFGELRRLNPNVRVVLASGYTHEKVASRFVGKNLDGVLQKPYTLARLRQSLAGLLPARSNGDG